jgi:hypothetical protein
MMIIGCDFHPSFQQIAYVVQETGWNEAQKRTLTFVPGSIVKVCRPVSRVKMNAKKRRP